MSLLDGMRHKRDIGHRGSAQHLMSSLTCLMEETVAWAIRGDVHACGWKGEANVE